MRFEFDEAHRIATVTDDTGDVVKFTQAGAAVVVSIGEDHAVSVPRDLFVAVAQRVAR